MADRLLFTIELTDLVSKAADTASKAIGKLADSMGELGPLFGTVAKTELAVAAGLASLVVGGAALALKASEAKQDTVNMLDAMLGSQDAAQDVYSKVEGLGGTIALSLERGSELARELSAAGVRNKDSLVDAIKTIGEVESVLGREAGGKIQNIISRATQTGKFKVDARRLVGTGIEENVLAKALGVTPKQLEAGKVNAAAGIAAVNRLLQDKFGAVAEKKALNIGAQFTRLKDNISKLFEDVDTGPFLEGFNSIVKVFDQSTESGKALKFLVTSFFTGLFKLVAKVAPYVTAFLKGMVIIGLKAYIALKPLGKAFGSIGDQKSGVDAVASVMSKLGDAIAFVIKNLVPAILFFGKLGSIFLDVESTLVGLVTDFYDAGSNIITGLVSGIKDGASKVVSAVEDTAHAALDKFTGIFGIHSDSKLMAKMGGHLMGGLESGIAANDNGPRSAMSDVMPSASAGAKGGSTSVTFGPGAIVIQINGTNASEISAQLRDVLPGDLAAMFETMGLSVGAA
jgi:hypothetical protein